MSTGILNEILDWSKNLQHWQQDGLRRVFENNEVLVADIAELTVLSKAENGIIPNDESIRFNPFGVNHIPTDRGAALPISLSKLHSIKYVNALAENQTLSFMKTGVTVVYGDNGAGKSGYARILKRACRSRDRGNTVIHNIFKEKPLSPASATIEYASGDSSKEISWIDSHRPLGELANVNVFDTSSASVHLTSATEVAFTPYGLDLLPKLANIYRGVQAELKKEIEQLNSTQFISKNDLTVFSNSKTAEAVKNISHKSNIEELRKLLLDEEGEKRRLLLKEMLSNDLKKQIADFNAKINRAKLLKSTIEKYADILSDERIATAKDLVEDWVTKDKAANLAAHQAFSSEPIPTFVSSNEWKALWESAKRYSIEFVYDSFPHTGTGAHCVLCQQPLNNEAKDRFDRFDVFVKADTAKQLTEASSAIENFNKIKIVVQKSRSFRDSFLEIEEVNPGARANIRAYLSVILLRNRKLQQSLRSASWSVISPLPPSPASFIDFACLQWQVSVDELKSSEDLEQREKLQKEYLELQARRWLTDNFSSVEKELGRLCAIQSLNELAKYCNTKSITDKGTELTNKYISETLQNRFFEELKQIGFQSLQLELLPGQGEYGAKKFQITIKDAKLPARCDHVLSEGEQKCISLAGFFTELATEPAKSAIIFDDPVSSLDHNWRRKIANRLVDEGRQRQVIIFSHDIVFFHLIEEACEKNEVSLDVAHLTRQRDQTGLCYSGIPWVAMTVKDRIKYLNGRAQEAQKLFNDHGDHVYRPVAKELYGQLRETWERAIEEVLLNKAVLRFGRAIETKRLKVISDITEADLALVDKHMSKCSLYVHDQPAEVNEPIPSSDELKADIKALEEWVSTMRKSRGRN